MIWEVALALLLGIALGLLIAIVIEAGGDDDDRF